MDMSSVVTLIGALGGYECVKWLVTFFIHRKQEKRLKENEVSQSEVATENNVRDMYEDAIDRMRDIDEKRIAEIRKDYTERINELREANKELTKQNLELLKAGARKDDIIADKVSKLREIQEMRVQDAERIGKLEGDVQYLDNWKCYREFGDGCDDCKRREPEQNPPMKYKPRKIYTQ